MYPGHPWKANSVVDLEGLLNVAVKIFRVEQYAERRSILDRHAGTLALMRHHGVCGVTKEADSLAGYVRVRVVDPQAPGLDFLSNGEMAENLPVEMRIWLEKLLNGAGLDAPRLAGVVALVAGKEAVVGKKLASVARGEDNLIPLSLLTTPIF